MKADYNYNYVFVFYDINEKRVQKIFKVCKKYLTHHQYSVFRGPITPSQLIKLRDELKKLINPQEDTITIIKLPSQKYLSEEKIGKTTDSNDNLFY